MFGTLRVGDRDLEVVNLKPEQGKLHVVAYGHGPVELAVPRAEWRAPDGTLMCVIEPFLVSDQEAKDARTASDVTVFQPIEIREIRVVRQPVPLPSGY
jgi:hypothetical protein